MPMKMNKKDCIIRKDGMSVKFTPGPWIKIRSSDLWYEILEEDNTLIADVLGGPNSSLIVAAPEMFELLEKLTDNDECQYDHHGNCQTHGKGDPCPNKEWKELKKRMEVESE